LIELLHHRQLVKIAGASVVPLDLGRNDAEREDRVGVRIDDLDRRIGLAA
jgi:hypothetical protein